VSNINTKALLPAHLKSEICIGCRRQSDNHASVVRPMFISLKVSKEDLQLLQSTADSVTIFRSQVLTYCNRLMLSTV